MSSSTPLLPKKKKDHPIFMRICHSSWSFIGQQSLVTIRTIIALYLIATYIALLHYDLAVLKLGWKIIFELCNISFLALTIYHFLAAIWAYMHLHYPHQSSEERSFSTRLQKFLSPPRQNKETANRDKFSIFYFASHAFTLLVAFIFWVISFPHKQSSEKGGAFFGHDDYRTFYFINKHGINAFLVVIEVFVLNGHVRSLPFSDHLKRLSWHVIAFAVLGFLYIGWAYIGHHYTKWYSYWFLDYKKYGKEYTWFSVFLFVLGVEGAALFLWLLTALKEKLTSKDAKKNGYEALPQ